MSNALAIAAVTSVLRDLLKDGLLEDRLLKQGVSAMLGRAIEVSLQPPDRVAAGDGAEVSQLNLFLRQVTPNLGWRNEGLPSRDDSGRQRLSNPPLALNLHYLLTAYSGGDLHAEVLLGCAMQALHETPVLTRGAIQAALKPVVPPESALEKALVESGLEHQIELIKITPESLSTEEMSNLWNATQSHFRPSAAYVASVVLIASTDPVRSPLPVLSRGIVHPVTLRDRGVIVEPGLMPPVPMLQTIDPDPLRKQPAASLGRTIKLIGHHLDGTAREAVLSNDRFEIEETIGESAAGGAADLQFAIPVARAADFPVGVYRVGARVLRPGETVPRETNRLAMTLAPEITNLPMVVMRDGAGTASFTIEFRPQLRAGQSVVLVLGQQEYRLQDDFVAPASSLKFVIKDAPVSEAGGPGHLVRLRIDGIENPIIDLSAPLPATPKFLNQRIKIQ
ncbi:DUF4255 domain-containing protein [Azotobacter chroococcum]|uniref:DUF4255 domain-containing protein n=1 Tax=Azotobacter chroococcum TaxID=353 RepID=UPI00103CA3A6|nr:DUF4255 domain-containing protein [Azotobacter chroococcum]TBW39883.1 DUF4255 domain-containing protein [Azotobacter chroococcum]